jgi:hypothetical protein
MGEAFRAEGRTSAEQFRRDPGSMRLETKPIIDRGANRGLVITIQVRFTGFVWLQMDDLMHEERSRSERAAEAAACFLGGKGRGSGAL